MFAQDVPGGAGDIGDNGGFPTSQLIEQARLAGVRPPGDDHRHAVTQQGTLPGLALHGG
ncbi:hypothetical protein D3C80_1834460 [compost metagenome]